MTSPENSVPDSDSWREKYLQSLDDQERLQAQAQTQVETLRKALVRVSLAADGLDPQLDQAMGQLRDQLRSKDKSHAGVEATIASLENTLLSFEQRRSHREDALQEALQQLCEGLGAVVDGRDLKKRLKQQASLINQLNDNPDHLPGLLKELAAIQSQLSRPDKDSEPSPAKSKGFLGRLFERGDNERLTESDDTEVDKQEPVVSPESVVETEAGIEEAQESEPNDAKPAEAILEGQLETHAEVVEQEAKEDQQDAEAVLQRPLHEPAFSRISDKILRVLNELLDNIEPTDCVVSKVASARARIEAGLNWFELVPTLEDIRDLIMQAYLAAGKEFGDYLLQVDQALNDISLVMGVVLKEHQAEQVQQQVFDQEVTEQLSSMDKSLTNAQDLDQLKLQVSSHIAVIRDALDKKQQPSQDQATSVNLADQLAQLAAQVKAIEEEAHTAKADLDVQREKALRDSLTELPNREAYSERVFDEFKRWQRYQRPLSLAVCDIDHFKRINDTYGHQAGDRVLKVLSRGIAKRLREVDFIARYGGEEFVLILPETEAEQALGALDKIREAIAQTPFHFKEEPVQITLSMGITEFGEGDTVESAFARADKQLYVAKEKGRNCCLIAE
jgi:diguanylate cyclase